MTTIRSDFLLYFSELPELQKALQQSTRYFLKPIGKIGLLDAVTTPLRRTKGWDWPKTTQYHQASQRHLTLPQTIVDDAWPERDAALPLASNLMNRLWAKTLADGRREPSFEDYYALEGIGGALAQSLDIQLGKLSDLEKNHARAVLLALVQDNDNAPATRRTISKSQAIAEVAALIQEKKCSGIRSLMRCLRPQRRPANLDNNKNPERMLDWLSGIRVDDITADPVRMIVISGDLDNENAAADAQQANDRKTVDLIHEILLRESRATGQAYCKTLSKWVADNRQQLKNRNLRQQLTQRWLTAKQKSPWSALFNDLANPKQIKDFLAAGSCTKEEKNFIKATYIDHS